MLAEVVDAVVGGVPEIFGALLPVPEPLTVIENAGVDSDELKFFQRYLPTAGSASAERGGAPAP